jgi:GTP-binding protein LepA
MGPALDLVKEKRGVSPEITHLGASQLVIRFADAAEALSTPPHRCRLPLGEIVTDFHDRLKSLSKGYASFDYTPVGFVKSDLVRLNILINGSGVDALSSIVRTSLNSF